MGALTADMVNPPRHIGGVNKKFTYKATGADTYFNGAIVCSASGKVLVTNADATTCMGIHLGNTVATAADDPIEVYVKGMWWIADATFADAALWTLIAPTAASDNPDDLVALGAGTPSALGTIIHVDATAVSGTVDLDQRVVVANT